MSTKRGEFQRGEAAAITQFLTITSLSAINARSWNQAKDLIILANRNAAYRKGHSLK